MTSKRELVSFLRSPSKEQRVANKPFSGLREHFRDVSFVLLNRKNSAYWSQTVCDLPTKVGRSFRPDGCPKNLIIVAFRGYAKLSLCSRKPFPRDIEHFRQ